METKIFVLDDTFESGVAYSALEAILSCPIWYERTTYSDNNSVIEVSISGNSNTIAYVERLLAPYM